MRAAALPLVLSCAVVPATGAAQMLTMIPQTTELRETGPRVSMVHLMLDAPAETPFMVMARTTGLTATAGVDFKPVVTPIIFNKGQMVAALVVEVMDDSEDEPDTEMFQLALKDLTLLDPEPGAIVVLGMPILHFAIVDNDHTLSVSAGSAPEGQPVPVTITQRFDSRETVNVATTVEGGSASPGVDFDPVRQPGYIREGQRTLELGIGTVADDEEEPDETVRLALEAYNPGTIVIEPETVSGTIIDATEEDVRPATLRYGPGTGYVHYEGDLVGQQEFPPQIFDIEMRMHIGGSGFTLSQQGTDLPFKRICGQDIDVSAAAQAIPGTSAADMRGAGAQAWRAGYTVEGVPFEYVLFGHPDRRLEGFATSEYVEGGMMAHNQFFSYIVTPEVQDPEPEVPRLEPDATPVVDPGAVRSSVARAIASDLGRPVAEIEPYLSTALSKETGTSPVEVRLFLDPDGRPVRADRAEPDPCDPAYGQMQPAARRLIYTVHAFEDRFVVQSKTQDVETGRYESAYMEDLGSASSGLDTAVNRSHSGLSPDLAPPSD
ncbi:Calx-beta domain-containing protein [Tranquillimonas rosea]|uniref:Calx-beta domain-containing protein n=1 Tax=Tranquillimonas rosea TaxID=641238 RepID=A0A1H9S7E0_9RHOB|nr:Calx-beta domain-containing protein [Tranquillimonas rosea]SER80545.1 Calx-beta domain-containing protein [Tranquillimonas rosea]